MDEVISLSVELGGRTYKLKTTLTDEEIFREAVKLITERMAVYAKSFTSQDKQDLLAMIAIEFSILHLKSTATNQKDIQIIKQKLSALDELLAD